MVSVLPYIIDTKHSNNNNNMISQREGRTTDHTTIRPCLMIHSRVSRQQDGIRGREGETASPAPSHSRSGRSSMAPVRYGPVPTMELAPLPGQLSPPRLPLPSQSSDSRSDNESPSTDRCRHDRRHGRLNTELLNAVLDGNPSEVCK